MSEPAPHPIRIRLALAVGVGSLAALFAGLMAARSGAVPDLLYPLSAARFLVHGQNPYAAMPGDPSATPPFNEPFFYPLTSVLALVPVIGLPLPIACALFVGVSSAILAFVVTRESLWRLHLFASAPFVVAATLSQFSPLMVVMAFVPTAGFLATLKPNLGVALFSYRPSWRSIIAALVVAAASLAVLPSWPIDWFRAVARDIGGRQVHAIPVLQTGGFVLLLAALAWRQAGGRLLLCMSLIPQGLFFYDQLPLWLIPRTRTESIFLTACSQAAMMLWFVLRKPGDPIVGSSYPYITGLIYLPALLLVLRHWRASRAPDGPGLVESILPARPQSTP